MSNLRYNSKKISIFDDGIYSSINSLSDEEIKHRINSTLLKNLILLDKNNVSDVVTDSCNTIIYAYYRINELSDGKIDQLSKVNNTELNQIKYLNIYIKANMEFLSKNGISDFDSYIKEGYAPLQLVDIASKARKIIERYIFNKPNKKEILVECDFDKKRNINHAGRNLIGSRDFIDKIKNIDLSNGKNDIIENFDDKEVDAKKTSNRRLYIDKIMKDIYAINSILGIKDDVNENNWEDVITDSNEKGLFDEIEEDGLKEVDRLIKKTLKKRRFNDDFWFFNYVDALVENLFDDKENVVANEKVDDEYFDGLLLQKNNMPNVDILEYEKKFYDKILSLVVDYLKELVAETSRDDYDIKEVSSSLKNKYDLLINKINNLDDFISSYDFTRVGSNVQCYGVIYNIIELSDADFVIMLRQGILFNHLYMVVSIIVKDNNELMEKLDQDIKNNLNKHI